MALEEKEAEKMQLLVELFRLEVMEMQLVKIQEILMEEPQA